MSNHTFTADATAKLRALVNEGLTVLQEVETLKEGLSETVKAIGEELDIKPSVLNRAIKVAHKQQLDAVNEENETLNHILQTVGRA